MGSNTVSIAKISLEPYDSRRKRFTNSDSHLAKLYNAHQDALSRATRLTELQRQFDSRYAEGYAKQAQFYAEMRHRTGDFGPFKTFTHKLPSLDTTSNITNTKWAQLHQIQSNQVSFMTVWQMAKFELLEAVHITVEALLNGCHGDWSFVMLHGLQHRFNVLFSKGIRNISEIDNSIMRVRSVSCMLPNSSKTGVKVTFDFPKMAPHLCKVQSLSAVADDQRAAYSKIFGKLMSYSLVELWQPGSFMTVFPESRSARTRLAKLFSSPATPAFIWHLFNLSLIDEFGKSNTPFLPNLNLSAVVAKHSCLRQENFLVCSYPPANRCFSQMKNVEFNLSEPKGIAENTLEDQQKICELSWKGGGNVICKTTVIDAPSNSVEIDNFVKSSSYNIDAHCFISGAKEPGFETINQLENSKEIGKEKQDSNKASQVLSSGKIDDESNDDSSNFKVLPAGIGGGGDDNFDLESILVRIRFCERDYQKMRDDLLFLAAAVKNTL